MGIIFVIIFTFVCNTGVVLLKWKKKYKIHEKKLRKWCRCGDNVCVLEHFVLNVRRLFTFTGVQNKHRVIYVHINYERTTTLERGQVISKYTDLKDNSDWEDEEWGAIFDTPTYLVVK